MALVSSGAVKDAADVVHRREVREERYEIGKLGVVRVVEPGRHGNGIVGVEDV